MINKIKNKSLIYLVIWCTIIIWIVILDYYKIFSKDSIITIIWTLIWIWMTFYSVIDSNYETINIKIENENELNRREIQKL